MEIKEPPHLAHDPLLSAEHRTGDADKGDTPIRGYKALSVSKTVKSTGRYFEKNGHYSIMLVNFSLILTCKLYYIGMHV